MNSSLPITSLMSVGRLPSEENSPMPMMFPARFRSLQNHA